MQPTHKDVVIKELKAGESLEVGKCVTLKSLKKNYGVVDKYTCQIKQSLYEQFVKWCCQKRRELSIGESNHESKSWMLQATRGRYKSPTRKNTMDILLAMRVKGNNTTKKLMMARSADRMLSSISNMNLSLYLMLFAEF